MLENETKVVNEIINKRKLCSIGNNDLNRLCRDFNANLNIVITTLEEKYSAIYEPSPDPNFCGGYRFNNPNLPKQDYFILNYLYKNENKYKPNSLHAVKADDDYYGYFAEEILRLEFGMKIPLEVIIKNLKEKNAFIGKDRIWFITTEKCY